ncbi:nucleotidyltransferase domain-containing protein [Amnibacterium sp. CER49]|uniref:nucleotidyltransferase domain-containing protein n=1 Tax=Amnibacterium sp. CER49 TaxID=3039161 RepID=UPI002449F4D2|nr:nucleotidyltransferase domain-containing protein [Amnibacterium sp. CER49]MDH2443143.1 nucleotidyltransferase domain-containing protein [Amnibacterium sp. CER49]
MRHHDDALQRYATRQREDDGVLGVILTGSLARGAERPDSDVDVILVVTDERFAAALDAGRLAYVETDDVAYEHGYIDVKLASPRYLEEAAERGDDPLRDGFAGARVVLDRIGGLPGLVARVAEVPQAQWDERAASFVAQARLHGGYFLVQGVERGDPLLAAHAAVHLATSAARAMLALNHVRFAGPKYLAAAVRALPRKPTGFDEALLEVVQRPSVEAGRRVLGLLEGAADWPLPRDASLSRFVLDNELAWRTRVPPPEYS